MRSHLNSYLMLQEPGEHSGRLTPEELEKVEMMHKYVLSNAHFYCETVDISKPFPSSRPVDQPSWEFVWNRWLSAPLRAVDLPTHCPHLMQVSGVLSDECVCPYVRLSVCLSVHPYICLSVCMSVCLHQSICLYVCLSVHVLVLTFVLLWPCLTARSLPFKMPFHTCHRLTQCDRRALAASEHRTCFYTKQL